MHVIAIAAAVVAALVHTWFFVLESLWFMRPTVYRRFGIHSAIRVVPPLVAILAILFLG